MTGVLYEKGTAYLSRAPGFIPDFLVVLLIFLVFCIAFLLCFSSSSVLCVQSCQCLSSFHSYFPLRLSLTFILYKAHQNKLHHFVFMKCALIMHSMTRSCFILIKLLHINLSKYIITVITLNSLKRISNILHLILKEQKSYNVGMK